MISSEHWNQAVREADRSTSLPGVTRVGGSSAFHHPFEVDAQHYPESTRRVWKITIEPSTVSDHLVVYPYQKVGDKRGWKMPAGYVTPSLLKYYGPNYPFVDRSPFETVDPPYLLIKAPPAGATSGTHEGDFTFYSLGRPKFFRQDAFQNCELWKAYVMITLTPFRASKDYTPFHASLVTVAQRFRYCAGRAPVTSDRVQAGTMIPIATLWLARKTDGSAPASDRLYIQQLHFWPIQALAIEPSLGLGDNIDLSPLAIGSLALGAGGAAVGFIATGMLEMVVNNLLAEANELMSESSSWVFWTA